MILADTFFWLTEPTWIAIVGGVVTCLLSWMKISADAAARKAEAKVEEVKVDLKATSAKADAKTDAIADVLHDVHTLTNSSMGLALTSNAALARWKANQTKGLPEWQQNEDAAIAAESALADHRAKQSVVDGGMERP